MQQGGKPTTGRVRIAGVETEVVTAGSGAPILVLHSGDAREFNSAFVEALARTNRVILPAHPGFRNTELPRHFTSVDDLAYFHLDLMKEMDLEDVCLIGMSFGGWIAAEIAVRATSRLNSLVLVDAFGIKTGDREEREIMDFFGVSTAELVDASFVDRSVGEVDLEAYPEDVVLGAVRNREALAYYGWRPYMHNPTLASWLHRIDVPTLVLWGEQDRVATTDYGRRYAERIPGARFRTVAEAGHYPHLERPSETASIVTEFLAEHAVRGRAA